jgi:hypothetical protein
MADRHLDLLGEDRPDHRARKLRNMNLFVLRHEGVAGERVVVLPAGERSDAAGRGLDDREARAVALAPDHPLMKRWCDLAALENQPTVGIENQLRIVERSVVALVDAERDHDAETLGQRRDRLGHGAGNDHRVLVEADMLRPGGHRRMDEGEVRIPGHEGLGKDDEPRPFIRRLGERGENLRHGPAGRIEIRRDLHRGDANQRFLRHAALLRLCAGERGHTVRISHDPDLTTSGSHTVQV